MLNIDANNPDAVTVWTVYDQEIYRRTLGFAEEYRIDPPTLRSGRALGFVDNEFLGVASLHGPLPNMLKNACCNGFAHLRAFVAHVRQDVVKLFASGKPFADNHLDHADRKIDCR